MPSPAPQLLILFDLYFCVIPLNMLLVLLDPQSNSTTTRS